MLKALGKVRGLAEEARRVLERTKRLLASYATDQEGQELLRKLPQGHGSGLDADMVDGLHAVEILARAPGRGGGGGGGMARHGNEWHTVPFAKKICQICEVDELPTEVAGLAVLLLGDSHVYVGTTGIGNVCGCVFESVDTLPDSLELGDVVFLTSDAHVYVGA